MYLLTFLMFVLIVSIDGLALGISYGIKKVVLPLHCKALIGIASTMALFLSMYCGQTLFSWISPEIGLKLSAYLLIGLGLYTVLKSYGNKFVVPLKNGRFKNIVNNFNLVFKDKRTADLDFSGSINTREAAILGMAVSADALSLGLGASIVGFDPIVTPIITGIMQVLFLTLGIYLGRGLSTISSADKFSRYSGGIIIFMGLIKMLN